MVISVWERLWVQVHILTCGRSMCEHSGLMLSFSPLLFYLINGGKGSPSDPELTDRASFPRQLALGSLCFDFLRLKLTGDSVHPQHLCGSSRSELFLGYTASALTTEPCPHPLCLSWLRTEKLAMTLSQRTIYRD